jgi:PLP dependent protein
MLQRLQDICTKYNAQLVAVSKTKPQEAIHILYNQGQRIFGENKVQEMVEKYEALPKDIQWHLIGHLQSNKVKNIVPFVHLIHSIDSLKLLNEVQKEAAKINRVVQVLLQFHIATEQTKFGLDMQEATELLEYYTTGNNFNNVQIIGVMGMASFTSNTTQVQQEFTHLKNIFQTIKDSYFPFNTLFKEISMGMSGDYELALQEGSTLIRVGSLLFGNR